MEQEKITAVILAAGHSSRMGKFKPLLEIGGRTIIERVVDLFKNAGITDIRVVVGHERELIEPILETAGIPVIVNRKNSREMFSSVLAALESLEPDVQTVILHPGDIPFIQKQTILSLLEQHRVDQKSILIPIFEERRGHPVVIPRGYFASIRKWNGKEGLRGALRHFSAKTVHVPVKDENILLDMDTIEDYEKAKERVL